jgi:hypothetical protein
MLQVSNSFAGVKPHNESKIPALRCEKKTYNPFNLTDFVFRMSNVMQNA